MESLDSLFIQSLVPDHSSFSRAERIQWYINNNLYGHSILDKVHEDPSLKFLLATSKENQIASLPSTTQYALTHESVIGFFYTKYSILLYLDVSSSLLVLEQDTVVFGRLYTTVRKCIEKLLVPIKFGNTMIQPELYLSVVVAGNTFAVFQPLVQGVKVNLQNQEEMVTEILDRLQNLEHRLAHSASLSGPLTESFDMAGYLSNALFAFKLFPDDTCPHIIFLTDGVTSLSVMNSIDPFVSRLNSEEIPFSVISLRAQDCCGLPFGYLPDHETLRQITQSTFGSFIPWEEWTSKTSPDQEPILPGCELNYVQKKFFMQVEGLQGVPNPLLNVSLPSWVHHSQLDGLYRNHVACDEMPIARTELKELMPTNEPFPWQGPSPSVFLVKTPGHTYLARIEIKRILEVRLKEGFHLWFLRVGSKRSSAKSYEITLLLPWKSNIKIAYVLKPSESKTHANSIMSWNVSVDFYSIVEFAQIYQERQKTDTALKLKGALDAIHDSDTVMSRFFPEMLWVHDETPVLSSTLDNQMVKTFWKYLNSLGTDWGKWFKTHAFEVVLVPDNIHNLMANPGKANMDLNFSSEFLDDTVDPDSEMESTRFRYSKIKLLLRKYLEEWASLMRSTTCYLKFLEPELKGNLPRPGYYYAMSFCLLQLTYHADSLVRLELSFFATAFNERKHICDELKRSLCDLGLARPMNSGSGSSSFNSTPGRSPYTPSPSMYTPSPQISFMQHHVAPLVAKPNERTGKIAILPDPIHHFLIKYPAQNSTTHTSPQPMPYRTNDEWDDYGQPDAPMDDWGSQKEAQQDTDTEKKASREELKRFLFGGVSPTLITHFYLQRYRWIWFVPSKSSQTSILDAISVSRLSEGFYPLSDETFFYQVPMKSGRTSCTQYLAYARYEMIITELWMEPQSGSPVHSDHRHHHHDKTIREHEEVHPNIIILHKNLFRRKEDSHYKLKDYS